MIDNIFTNNFDKDHLNGVLTAKISDHQITCCFLNENTTKVLNKKKYVEIENMNTHNLENLRKEIEQLNIYEQLDHSTHANPSENCQILMDVLSKTKDKHIPIKIRKFNKRKDKKEKWMTDELLAQINQKNDMYIDWRANSADVEIYNNKEFITYKL